ILKMLPEHAKQVAFIFGSFTVRTWLCYLRLRKRYDLICNLKFPKTAHTLKCGLFLDFYLLIDEIIPVK
ncbi:hypothetical protein, partial [Peribacillus frigoritolerans]|uniref:hypothetical protein n=1 Tax=Peribacillus frigoritolerans TaxID=450367 RepID=UPI001E520436